MNIISGLYNEGQIRVGIVATRFNEVVVSKLVDGAADGLSRHGVDMAPAAPAEPDGGKLVRGHIEIDPERPSARRCGQNAELTRKEFDLIELLMRSPGKVYSREQLLDLVWGYDYQGDIRTVDVHIRRLREKLERSPAAPEYIITKFGVCFFFAFV